MAVKDTKALTQWCADVIGCCDALKNLHDFTTSLPLPEDGRLLNVDEQCVDRLSKFREAIAAASKLADEFWQ